MKKNLIVPMAGFGSRFKKAGYETYKPFIEIKDKPMIQYVLDAFPDDVGKHIIINPELVTAEQKKYLADQPNVVLHEIEPHKNGPAWSIHQIGGQLKEDEGYFIAYCDIFWTWNYAEVEKSLDNDGVIFTRRAFHPHLVNNNFSAFCRPSDSDPDLVAEIQEKASFTDDWMNEPLSVGTFYFRSGADLARSVERLIAADSRVAGEFFPSVLFNDLIKGGKKVAMHDVDFFIHWGVPDQLNDFLDWSAITGDMRRSAGKPAARSGDFVNICCMGGLGSRMKAVSDKPKALVPVGDKPMFEAVAEKFGCEHNIALTVNTVYPQIKDSKQFQSIVDLGDQTGSQIETLQRAKNVLKENKGFYLTSCDAYGLYDGQRFAHFISEHNPDAVIFTFEPSLMQAKLAGHHTHVSLTDGDRVSAVHVKGKSSDDDKGLAGFFWFADGSDFELLDELNADIGRELIVDDLLKHMVEQGKKVMGFMLDQYIHIGTVDEYREFQFWMDFAEKPETRINI